MAQNINGGEVEETKVDQAESVGTVSADDALATPGTADHESGQAAEDAEAITDAERDPIDVSMEEVQKILNQDTNSRNLPKSVQKLLISEKESSRRTEEAIKKAKSNPGWFVPLFCILLIVGLAWVVVNYITHGTYPIPGLGNWNLLIGFVTMMVGFLMTMWWN